jgi:hypothetical protein
MIPGYTHEVRPLPLEQAALLARVTLAELLAIAEAPELTGEYGLSVFVGTGGMLFDPDECLGIAIVLGRYPPDAKGGDDDVPF